MFTTTADGRFQRNAQSLGDVKPFIIVTKNRIRRGDCGGTLENLFWKTVVVVDYRTAGVSELLVAIGQRTKVIQVSRHLFFLWCYILPLLYFYILKRITKQAWDTIHAAGDLGVAEIVWEIKAIYLTPPSFWSFGYKGIRITFYQILCRALEEYICMDENSFDVQIRNRIFVSAHWYGTLDWQNWIVYVTPLESRSDNDLETGGTVKSNESRNIKVTFLYIYTYDDIHLTTYLDITYFDTRIGPSNSVLVTVWYVYRNVCSLTL